MRHCGLARHSLCLAALLATLPGFLGVDRGCSREESAPPSIKVGAVLPLSGERVSYGRDALNGILSAVETINRRGGVDGRRIDLLVANNRSRPEGTLEAISDLDRKGVVAIVGPLDSDNARAAGPAAQERRIPLVLPAATLGEVTRAGEYVSRVCFTNEFQSRMIAHFALEFLRARSFAVVAEAGADYSLDLAERFARAVERMGGEVVLSGEYRAGQKDFGALAATVVAAQPDAVFLPGYCVEVSRFLDEARERGLDVPVLGGDGWDVPRLVDKPRAGRAGDYFAAHFAADEPVKAVTEFVECYRAKYGYAPHSLAALGYDAVCLVADALERSSDQSRESLKNAVNSTRGFRGLTGTLSLDANRNGVKSGVILKTTASGVEFIARVRPQEVLKADTAGTPVPTGLWFPRPGAEVETRSGA